MPTINFLSKKWHTDQLLYQLPLQDFDIRYCFCLSLCEEKLFINFIKERKSYCYGNGVITELLSNGHKMYCHQVYNFFF